MEDAGEQEKANFGDETRKVEGDLSLLTQKARELHLRVEELQEQEKKIKNLLKKIEANIGSRATPVEWLMGIGVAVTSSFCVLMLLCAFYRFREALLCLAEAKPVLWSQIHVHSGQTAVAQSEWPASSLAWTAGVGFVALAVAISVVAVGASVALSRIRRE